MTVVMVGTHRSLSSCTRRGFVRADDNTNIKFWYDRTAVYSRESKVDLGNTNIK